MRIRKSAVVKLIWRLELENHNLFYQLELMNIGSATHETADLHDEIISGASQKDVDQMSRERKESLRNMIKMNNKHIRRLRKKL